MARGTNARGRGRGRTSRQAKRPVRYRDAEAEVEVPTQPTARDPSPEPTTPAMEATLGAIMSRLDDMQRQINENKSPVATSPPRARKYGKPFGVLFIISRYRKLFPDIRNSNSRYREMNSRYREFEFRILGNMELFSDIGKSISRYQEIIPDIEKWISFSDI